jgi:SAM-dependent methyltransferase
MIQDTMPEVARYWNRSAEAFDSIYTGRKSPVARTLDQVLRRDMYQRFEWVMARAGDVRGRSVCDIGCGSGRYVAEFARRGAARAVGVDVAPEMLRLATLVAEQEGRSSICEFVQADVLDWRPSERFDISIAIGLWDYIADPGPRLGVIHDLTSDTFLSAWPRLWTWRMPIRKARLTAAGCPVYFFRRADVYRHLEAANFVVESCEVIGKLYCVVARPR